MLGAGLPRFVADELRRSEIGGAIRRSIKAFSAYFRSRARGEPIAIQTRRCTYALAPIV